LVNGFSGPFSAANWTSAPDTSLDASNAPSSFTLSGTESGSGLEAIFSISVPLSVDQDTIAVNWTYTTSDLSPASDEFGYLVNGVDFVNLSDPFGATSQSGSTRLGLSPTDTFSFAIRSTDNLGGTAQVVLSDFRAGLRYEVPKCPCPPPPSVPVPLGGPIVLLGSLAGFWQARRLRSRPTPTVPEPSV
jgi:hypothetical protein